MRMCVAVCGHSRRGVRVAGLARRTPVHGQGSATAPALRRNPATELRLRRVASSFVLIPYFMLHSAMHVILCALFFLIGQLFSVGH